MTHESNKIPPGFFVRDTPTDYRKCDLCGCETEKLYGVCDVEGVSRWSACASCHRSAAEEGRG